MTDWKPFIDNNGPNNSFQLGNGYQLHCHGSDFQGPASLQHQASDLKIPMNSGDTLYSAAMLDAAKLFSK